MTTDETLNELLVRLFKNIMEIEARCLVNDEFNDITYNDFASLFESCPHIHTVLCNGGTAHSLFMKSGYAQGKNVIRMPSTSPAYTMAYAKKLEIWKETLQAVLKMDKEGCL